MSSWFEHIIHKRRTLVIKKIESCWAHALFKTVIDGKPVDFFGFI